MSKDPTHKKPMDNAALDSFLSNDSKPVELKPWSGKDPTAKRVGTRAYNIALNEFEKSIIDEAATREGGNSTAFMRQAALKRAKIILGLV